MKIKIKSKNKIRSKSTKRLFAAALLGTLTLSLFGCQTSPAPLTIHSENLTDAVTAETVTGKEADATFCQSTSDFSIRLFQAALAETETSGENLLLSPESVLSALAMTANGAGSSTRTEMEQVLCGGMPIDEFNPYMYSFQNRLTSDEAVTFHQANSIWIRNQEDVIQMKEDFLRTDKNYYGADAYYAAFDDQTVQDINSWVQKNTNDMIPSLLQEPIPDDIVLYLINALAFEGDWETPYTEDQIAEDRIFTNYDGAAETVTMLNSDESVYLKDKHATGFLKYYKGANFAFLALLPEEGMTPEEYAATLTGDSYLSLYQNRENREVLVQLPEFTYDYSTELSKALSDMGMSEAFDASSADFSNMASTDTGYLSINRVLHKTHIEVDRTGTKAAAVTAIEMTNESCAIDTETPPSVILDRPFVYAIVDTESGMPIFLGIVNTIE